MKFTQGYWMIRQTYIMSYATHAVRVTKTDRAMQVISACRPITNRGAILDGGTLTVTFTAPRKNIIRVKVTHFAGTPARDPKFETFEEDVIPEMSEDEMLKLLATDGMLVKRPLLIGNDFVLVGFKEAEWDKVK